MLSTLSFLAADAPLIDNFANLHQMRLMNSFFNCDSYVNTKADAFLPRNITEDVCQWPGVACTDGAVTSIYYANLQRCLSIRRPPPTVRNLHLRRVDLVRNWSTDLFPRDLRYACVMQCGVPGWPTALTGVRLDRLPVHLEELIVTCSMLAGPIILTKLPQKMRFLLMHAVSLDGPELVVVDYGLSPDSLQEAYVHSASRRRLDFAILGGAKSDGRVRHAFGGWSLPSDQTFLSKLRSKSVVFADLDEKAGKMPILSA